MAEEAPLARVRAEAVKKALIMRGIPPASIRIVKGLPGPYVAAAFDGLMWPEPRRVDIRIIPESR